MRSKLLRTILVAFLSVVILGCQPTGQRYLNAVADSALIFQLPASGGISLDWQDMYLKIDHQVTATAGALSVQGTIGYANHPQIMYARAQNLNVYLFLLDSDKRVVSYQQLSTLSRFSTQDTDSFKMDIPRPVKAVAYTFGYEVDFIEGEPDSGMTTVWNLPEKN